jgi:hypothetical protein
MGFLEQKLLHEWWQVSDQVVLIICLALLFLAGLYISLAAMKGRFHHYYSLVPAVVFYTLVFLLEPASISLSPIILLLIICRVYMGIAESYNRQHADGLMLDAGLWCGFMTWWNPLAAFLLLVIILAFSNQRTVSFREVVILISGWLVIQFLFACTLFFYGGISQLPAVYLEGWQVGPSVFPEWVMMVKVGIVLIFLLVSLSFIFNRFNSQLIQFRRNIRVLLFFLVALLTLSFFQEGGYNSLEWLICGPIAIYIAWWWSTMKNQEAAAILHITLLGLVFVFQYINFV